MTQIKQFAAKSKEASRLRQVKYELIRKYRLPENLVGGSLCKTHRRCGKSNCRCRDDKGHPLWSLTFCRRGKKRVERVPEDWLAELEQEVLKTQEFIEAIKEVMAINVELLSMTRREECEKVRQRKKRTKRAKK